MFSGENVFTHAAKIPNNTNDPRHSKHNVGFIPPCHNSCITLKLSTIDDMNVIIVSIIDIMYTIVFAKLFNLITS